MVAHTTVSPTIGWISVLTDKHWHEWEPQLSFVGDAMFLLFYVKMNHWGTAWKLWTFYKWTQRQKATVTINWRELHNELSSAPSSKNVQDQCTDMSAIIKQKEQYMRINSVILLFKKKKARQHLFEGVGEVSCPTIFADLWGTSLFPLVPTSPPLSKGNAALYCCHVTLVGFSSACSDST